MYRLSMSLKEKADVRYYTIICLFSQKIKERMSSFDDRQMS